MQHGARRRQRCGRSLLHYVNPLEVRPPNCKDHTSIEYLKPVRQPWFEVACCPLRISPARLPPSASTSMRSMSAAFMSTCSSARPSRRPCAIPTSVSSSAAAWMHGGALELTSARAAHTPHRCAPAPAEVDLRVRLPPEFREEIQPAVENGYAVLAVNCAGEHHFTLSGSVPVHRCAANPVGPRRCRPPRRAAEGPVRLLLRAAGQRRKPCGSEHGAGCRCC